MTRYRKVLIFIQQLNVRTAVSKMFVFPSWLKNRCLNSLFHLLSWKKWERGSSLYPFYQETKSVFSNHLHISTFLYLPRTVHLVTYSCRGSCKLSPTMEAGKKKGLGNECWVSQSMVSIIDATNSL